MVHIVIIGGSYAGCGVAHDVLKNVPQANVTLVNPSDVFYFNIASPRVMAKPDEVDLNKVLIPIPEAFKQYSSTRFTFIRGSVSSLDTSTKTVAIDAGQRLSYDYVIIASGSTTPGTIGVESIPFKATTGNDIREKIVDAQKRIKSSSSVIITGAGPVGTEIAGEIAQAYPHIKVTLVSSHEHVLPALKASAGKSAESSLQRLGVNIIRSSKVTSSMFDSSKQLFLVALDTGKMMEADLVISAVGNIANTSFMSPDLLDSDGWIKVDANLRVTGVHDGSAYALGDATIFKQRYMLKVQDQIPVVSANLQRAITNAKPLVSYNANDKLMVFVPIGNNAGTGQVGGFVLFSFMVAFAKGKDYFISKAATYISAK